MNPDFLSAPAELARWGFTPARRSEFFDLAIRHDLDPAAEPARVIAAHRGALDVMTAAGVRRVRLAGALVHEADPAELPAVGDWVAVDRRSGLVVSRLGRTSVFVRQAAGRRVAAQVVAANVDTVFVVTSADEDFSPHRLERYRRAIAQGGAEPVALLNKIDRVSREEAEALVAVAARTMPCIAISAARAEGIDALGPWLVPGQTVALVGSSGVGKSTLLNRLLGHERQATSEVRASDSTGRHTTTRRELLLTPSGALLVDTPGMRALQLWADGEEAASDDRIAALARGCRFSDCTHHGEPGCAVLEALAAGRLAADDLAVHEQLERELAFQRRRQDEGLARAERDRWKAIHRQQRERTRHSPKG